MPLVLLIEAGMLINQPTYQTCCVIDSENVLDISRGDKHSTYWE